MSASAQFSAAGEALYGPDWRRKLGEALGVNERQIRRWANGEYDPPPGVWADLAKICTVRSAALSAMASQLRGLTE